MNSEEKQKLLDIIERQAAEILVLRQTIDALTRRIFGAKSEKLDPAQLLLLLESDHPKKPQAAAPADPGPAADIKEHKKRPPKTRAPRIPQNLPLIREELDPLEVQLHPQDYRRIGEEIREQLHYQPAQFLRLQLVRGKYIRKNDPLAKPTIAALPPSLQDRCIATPGLIAEIIDTSCVISS